MVDLTASDEENDACEVLIVKDEPMIDLTWNYHDDTSDHPHKIPMYKNNRLIGGVAPLISHILLVYFR